MKIRHSLYLILLLFSMIPVILFGIYIVEANSKHIVAIMSENVEVVSNVQIAEIQNFFQRRGETLEIICQLDIVKDNILRPEETSLMEQGYLNNMLATRVSQDGYTVSLTIVDKDFHVVACSIPEIKGRADELDSTPDKLLDGELYFSNVMNPNTKGNEKTVVAAVRGVFEKEELIGYIIEEISVEYFEEVRRETGIWEDGTIYLVDGNGRIITAGAQKEESRQSFVSTAEERKEFSEQWNRIDFNQNPHGEIRYGMRGMKYITYYALIDHTDWFIMVSVNLSSFLRQKNYLRILFAGSFCLLLILLICINHFISRKITRPIERVSKTLKEIRTMHDYSARIPEKGQDELAVLSQEINVLLNYIERENLFEKEQQRKLRHLAEQDPLTRVYNKEGIGSRLNEMLRSGEEQKAVLFLDIDDFKKFNTLYGHMIGDEVLKFVAAVLKLETAGIVGRVGGDEFVAGINRPEILNNLESTVECLIACLNQGLMLEEEGIRIPVFCSIGVAVTEGFQASYEEMLVLADKAMFIAKEKGKNGYEIFRGNRENPA